MRLHYLWISEDIRILQSFRQTKIISNRKGKKVEFIITYTVCIFYIFEVSSPCLGFFYYDLNSNSSLRSVQRMAGNGFY